MAQGGWFAYDQGGDAAHFGSFRLYRLRPFHTVQLNAVGWAVLLCAALPMVMLLLFVARWSAWLSIVASVVVTVAGAIVLDRRKEAASWVGRRTDLNETELQTVVAELQALGIGVELSRHIPYDRPESWGETELEFRYRHPALVQHASDPRVPRHRLVRRVEQVRGESEVEQAWRCDLDAIMDGTPTGEFQDKPAARSSATSR